MFSSGEGDFAAFKRLGHLIYIQEPSNLIEEIGTGLTKGPFLKGGGNHLPKFPAFFQGFFLLFVFLRAGEWQFWTKPLKMRVCDKLSRSL